jgi:MATE family multidrug resistance protein
MKETNKIGNLEKNSQIDVENSDDEVKLTLFGTENFNKDENVNFMMIIYNLSPNLANSLIYFSIGIIETHFVGKTKDTHLLAGVALGQLFNNIFIYYIGLGLLEGLAVLGPKSFGSHNFKLLGDQTNQLKIIICSMFFLYYINCYYFGEQLLIFMAGNKPYVEIAHKYIIYNFPSVFMDLWFEIYSKYAEAQQVYTALNVSFILAFICHPIVCFLFIIQWDLGVMGVCIASNFTQFIKLSIIYIYFSFFNPYPESNRCFNMQILKFKNFWPTLKITLLSMVIFFAENLGICISNFIANNLSEISYAKVVIMLNMNLINYSISYSFMNTICCLVGNFVGENSPKKVKNMLKYIVYLGLLIELPLLASFLFFKMNYFRFFSENITIFTAPDLNQLIYLIIFYGFIDFINACFLGFLRGLEVLNVITTFSIIIFLIFLPIQSLIYTFIFKMDISGIILAECMSYTLASLVWFFYIVIYVDIDKICEEYQDEEESKLEDKELVN